ncbi:MAG TPA: CbtA family protein [Dongiaceae bacterium]|nr:CbtA family protein [Dongiaceae bacterium]
MLKFLSPPLSAALLAALVLSLAQVLWVSPLILQAETYETAGATPEPVASTATEEAAHQDATVGHDHGTHDHGDAAAEHHHDESEWAPEDGWQRHVSTFSANLLMAVGYALVLCGLYVWRAPSGWGAGLLWGAAGYTAFFLAPALGLAPELPGTLAADLELRQGWWLLTAVCTGAGLAVLAWARPLLKLAALPLLAIPHVVGAPHPEHSFALAPEALTEHFIVATALVNVLFWLVLGAISAQLFARARRQDEVALPGVAV